MYIVKLENLLNYFSFFYWYITLVDELIGIIAAHLDEIWWNNFAS